MRAGLLRKRLVIQSATETAAVNGERGKTWATVSTVWGSIEPLMGKELLTAQQVSARVTHKITVRRGGLSPRQRVQYKTRTFHVESALDQAERGILTTLLATEVAL